MKLKKFNPAAAQAARSLRFYPFTDTEPDVSLAEAIVRFDHALGKRPTNAMLNPSDYTALMQKFGFAQTEIPPAFRFVEPGQVDVTIRPGETFVRGMIGVTL